MLLIEPKQWSPLDIVPYNSLEFIMGCKDKVESDNSQSMHIFDKFAVLFTTSRTIKKSSKKTFKYSLSNESSLGIQQNL